MILFENILSCYWLPALSVMKMLTYSKALKQFTFAHIFFIITSIWLIM